MATTGNLENKPVLVSEMRKYVGNISAHARGGNTLKATKTGAMVSVDDAYAGALLGLTVYGNSVQDGTPTPESPVEIKSVHAVSAVTSGKNLFAATALTATSNGVTRTANGDGTFTINGKASAGINLNLHNSALPNIPIGPRRIYVAGTPANAPINMFVNVRRKSGTSTYTSVPQAGTLMDLDAGEYVMAVYVPATTDVTFNNVTYSPILSTEPITGFEQFSGSTTPLTLVDSDGNAHELRSLPDGTRDELVINADGSGTIIENAPMVTFDGTESWTLSSSGTYFYRNITSSFGAELTQLTPLTQNLCDTYAVTAASWSTNATPDKSCTIQRNGVHTAYIAYIKDSRATTVAEMKALLAANPVKMVYATEHPLTYHIPAINMPALPDLVANCWLSATDASGAAIPCEVGIEYRRDINKVIDDIETAIADIVSA